MAQPQAEAEPQRKSYAEMYQELHANDSKRHEDEDKRLRRQRTMAAIGDAFSGLSSIFNRQHRFTPQNSMSERVRERWERIMEQRKAEERSNAEGMLRARQLDDALAQQERNWKRTLEQQERANARADAKEERADRKLEFEMLIKQAELELKQARDNNNHELALKKQEEVNWYHRQYLAHLQGKGHGRPGEYPWHDKQGRLHYAHSYEAMRQESIRNGTWVEGTQTSTVYNGSKDRGSVKNYTEKTGKGYSAPPEQGAPERERIEGF